MEMNDMKKLRAFGAALLIASLAACDEQPARPAAKPQQAVTANDAQTFQGIEQMEARLLMNPNDFETLAVLGDMYFEASRFVEAFQTYDKALAVNPNCADCYNDRGLSLFYLGDPVSALESFDKAIAIDPGYVHAWLSKGFVLTSVGRYQEAVAPLNKVKELDTSGPLALQADEFLAMGVQNSNP